MLNTPCPSLLFFFILVELKWGLGDKAPHSQSQLRNWLSAKTEDRIPEKLKSVIEARWLFPSGCENPHIGRSLDRALRFVFNKVSGSISFSYCPIPRLTLDFFFSFLWGCFYSVMSPRKRSSYFKQRNPIPPFYLCYFTPIPTLSVSIQVLCRPALGELVEYVTSCRHF